MSNEVVTFIPSLRAFARSLCYNAADADDLVQETLMRSIEHFDKFTPGTNLRAWLFTIMRNRFYTNTVKRARERTGDLDCVSAQLSTPATQEWSLRGKELEQALAKLPVHYREALVLVVVLGTNYIDAAQVLNCEVGTIKSRINRARNLLREALGETV